MLEPSLLRRASSDRSLDDDRPQDGHLHRARSGHDDGDTLGSSTSLSDDGEQSLDGNGELAAPAAGDHLERVNRSGREKQRRRRRSASRGPGHDNNTTTTSGSLSRHSTMTPVHSRRARRTHSDEQPVHLTGVDLDQAVINSKVATNYRQTFHNSMLIDDVTLRLAKLHIAYQILVMIIIMIFGE